VEVYVYSSVATQSGLLINSVELIVTSFNYKYCPVTVFSALQSKETE
jgi:hypothetical protein